MYCVNGFCNLCPCDDANYLLSDSYADTADSRTDRVRYGGCDTEQEYRVCVAFIFVLLCKRFILPHVLNNDRCSISKTEYRYRVALLFKELNTCTSEVLLCSKCGHCLCTCTIESLNGCCPWCGEKG